MRVDSPTAARPHSPRLPSNARETPAGSWSRGPTAAALLAIVAVIGVSLGPSLVGNRVFAGTDILRRFAPWGADTPVGVDDSGVNVHDTVDSLFPRMSEFVPRLKDGELVQWEATAGGGTPLSLLDSGQFGPSTIAYLVLPFALAIGYARLFAVLASLGFTYLFLRRLGLAPASALVGGLAFGTSGFLIAWNNWPQAQVASLIPAVFWAAERHLQRATWSSAVPLALGVAALILSGFPAVAGYTLYALVPYVVLRVRSEQAGRRLVSLAPAALAVVAGVGLAAFQIIPFLERIAHVDTTYRAQSAASHLPIVSLFTLAVPKAFGNGMDSYFLGYRNFIETLCFIGAAALVLVVVALVHRFDGGPVACVRRFAIAGIVVVVALGWGGGLPLRLAQELPIFSTNFVGRIRSILGFLLAILVALGFEAVHGRATRRSTLQIGWASTSCRVSMFLGTVALLLFLSWKAWGVAEAAGKAGYLLAQSVLPAVAAVTAAGMAVLALQTRTTARLKAGALVAVPVIMAVEALVVIVPFWPTVPPEDFYPTTSTHRFLDGHLGNDRFAAGDGTMFPSTSIYYGLRSVTAHAFHDPAWKQMIAAVDPARGQGPTLSFLSSTEPSATSPLLDRLSARYFVVAPGVPIWGERVAIAASGPDRSFLEARHPLAVGVGAGPLRGATIDLLEPFVTTDPLPVLQAALVDDQGVTVGTSRSRLPQYLPAGPLTVAVPGEDVPDASEPVLRLTLEARDGRLVLPARDGAAQAAAVIKPSPNGLRLVFAGGTTIWERSLALPRIRWASRSVVETDPQRRLRLLSSGLDADTVVLSEVPDQPGGGRPADVELTSVGPDRYEAVVKASDEGFLVVADALQHGWRASLDGNEVPLVDADHAGVAVEIPGGRHDVTLWYAAPGNERGRTITVVSAAGLAVMGLSGRRRRVDRCGWPHRAQPLRRPRAQPSEERQG